LTSLVSESEAETSYRSASSLFAILDDHLARTPFVAGDNFTMGDIPVGVIAHQWLELPRSLPPLAHVRRWREQLARRPGARQTFALPVGLMPNDTFPVSGSRA
jgi:glutathione S-transferase